MEANRINCRKPSESGVALLIAIFVLLLISVIAISLIVASGSESTLAGNYRSSTSAFFAGTAGLEEARGRLSRSNPDYYNIGKPLALGQVRYILNPAAGESAATLLATYPDNEYATEFAGTAYATPTIQNTNSIHTGAAIAGPLYKWVRINAITEKSINKDVNNDGTLDQTTPLYFDGTHLLVNTTPTGEQALEVTTQAVLPNGTRKLLQYVLGAPSPVLVDSAVHTRLDQVMGDALNITGFTDPVCTLPSTIGAVSGSTVTIPGKGNVTGSPTAVSANAPFPYDLTKIMQSLKPVSQPIDSPGTAVTGIGTPLPTSYTGPHAVLGVVPTVTYDSTGGITAITAPGTPAVYLSPADLTLGTPVIGGAPVTGHGVLLVQGNLTIDITNGFNYFGLIVVTGDVIMTANAGTSATSNVHGTIIGGGKFTSNLANLGGTIFIHQNACLVNGMADFLPRLVLSFREISQ
jgi:hypothetical protein